MIQLNHGSVFAFDIISEWKFVWKCLQRAFYKRGLEYNHLNGMHGWRKAKPFGSFWVLVQAWPIFVP